MTTLKELVFDFDPESEPAFALENVWYMVEFTPINDETIDYKQVADYSRTLWSEMTAGFDALDKKAEWIFGLGILSVGAVAWMLKEWHVSRWLLVPSLLCIFFSLFLAVRARMPRRSFAPLSPKAALERAEADPKHLQAWLAASIHVAVSGVVLICDRKAALVKWSVWSLVAGAALLSIGVLAPQPAPTPAATSSSPPPSAPSPTSPNKTP